MFHIDLFSVGEQLSFLFSVCVCLFWFFDKFYYDLHELIK